ncbi:protein kinase domain-containing protein [Nocardia asteroides]|uniref:protein kinase domain-containing protein n=1 Tax=Nocardia asteroides TaxID=1824 RepID=UPI00344353FA
MADREFGGARGEPLTSLPDDLSTAGFEDAHAIGSGGFGVVFRCRQRSLDRLVAVKVMTADLGTDNVERFLREQQAMSRLSGHPNIVNVFEAGVTRTGVPYIVMQYQPRGSLETYIKRDGPVQWTEALRLGVKIAGALETAHRLAVLHRDIKPANILLTRYGDPQLTDFGIAHVAGAFETAAGTVTGSPAFTAPEVLSGGPASPGSDVYSLGVTLFCALTGHAPFERQVGEQVVAQFLRITTEPLPGRRGKDIPDDIYDVIEQSMARDPAARPATAADFGEQLRAAQRRHDLAVVDMALALDATHESDGEPSASSGDADPSRSTTAPRGPTWALAARDTADARSATAAWSGTALAARVNGKPGNIPLPLTHFVGRRHEVKQAKKLLAANRLITLTGIGGVGKTRLALRIATELSSAFTNGAWLVDLGEIREPALAAGAVSTALGIRQDSPEPPVAILIDHLATRQLLLVLDNCEHLVDTVAPLAEKLLHACEGLRVLATSREPLRITGEAVMRVPPLRVLSASQTPSSRRHPRSDAVTLFADRAAAAVPEFELTDENLGTVVQICDRLDGLPLAIELAAAQLRALSTQQILDRLTDRFQLLAVGSRGTRTRQQTLRWCIDWSYGLCAPDEQRLWALLAVFAGSFELDAAQAVSDSQIAPEKLLDSVASLIDKSILIREGTATAVRYRLLDTLRDYGWEKVKGRDISSLRRQHQRWYEQLVLRAEADWVSPHQLDWISRLEQEQPNIREALQFCLDEPGHTDAGIRIAAALYPFWLARGLLTEGRLWLARMLGSSDSHMKDWAKAAYLASVLAGLQGDRVAGAELLADGDAAGDHLANGSAVAHARFAAGYAALYNDAPMSAVIHLEEALRASEHCGSTLLRIGSLLGLGLAYMELGDPSDAARCHERILSETDGRREYVYRGRSSVTAGWALWKQTGDEPAMTALEEGARLSRQAGDPVGMARCLQTVAWIEADRHHERRAAVLLGAADRIWHEIGGPTAGFLNRLDDHTRCERHTRRALGDPEFEKRFRRGYGMGALDAATYAFEGEAADEEPPLSAEIARLTPRERQVAELVAEGLSNRAIAATLVIAPRTAEGHVERILTKLGFTSRAQIAAWFVAQSHTAGP